MEAQQPNHAPSDLKDEMVKCSSSSICSASTTETLSHNAPFSPDRSLFINCKGIRAIRLPVPSFELEIPIYDADANLMYTSTRERKWSGDAVLSSPKGGDLVSTSYFFGPNRNPIIQQLHPSDLEVGGSIEVTGKWTSRDTAFTLSNGKTFEWSYVREKQPDGKKRTLLVLHLVDGKSTNPGRRLAQLVRSSETRPPGASKCNAGTGGELVLNADAVEWIDEPMVVATCILMLKKEIDRRRLIQAAVLSGGGGGG